MANTIGDGAVAKRLEFSGEVDAYGYETDLCEVSPVIGGENVVNRLQKEFGQDVFSKPEVTVYLGAEPLKTGPLWTLQRVRRDRCHPARISRNQSRRPGPHQRVARA